MPGRTLWAGPQGPGSHCRRVTGLQSGAWLGEDRAEEWAAQGCPERGAGEAGWCT